MKIRSITIENFRGYKKFEKEFTSNIILIYGRNGYGKTSLFDSIEWCLTGDIKRIEEKDDNKKAFKNINSATEGKVQIVFEDGYTIERKINSNNESILKEPESEKEVKDFLFKESILEENTNDLFNFSYLLSQDLISDFTRNVNPKERYAILAKMLGLSNEYDILEILTEEHKNLKKSKKVQEKEQEELNDKLKIYSNDLEIEVINDKMSSKIISNKLKKLNINEIDKTLKKEVKELKDAEGNILKYINICLILKKAKEFELKESQMKNIKDKKENLDYLYLKKEIEELKDEKLKSEIMISNNLSIIGLSNCEELELHNKREEYLEKKYTLAKSEKSFIGLEEIFKGNEVFLGTLSEYKTLLNELKTLEKVDKNLKKSRSLYEGLTNKLYNAVNDFIQNKEKINECPLCNNDIRNKEELEKLIEKNLNIDSNTELKEINKEYSENTNSIDKTKNKIEEKIIILEENIRKEISIIEEKIKKIENILKIKTEEKIIDLNIETKSKKLKVQNKCDLLEENLSLEKIEVEKKHLSLELIKLENKEYSEYLLYKEKYKFSQVENKLITLKVDQEKRKKQINELEELKKYLLESKRAQEKRAQEKKYNILKEGLDEIDKNIKEVEKFRKKANSIIGVESKTYIKGFEESVKRLYNYLTPQKNFPDIQLPLKQYPKAPSEADLEIEKNGKQYNPLSLLSSAQKNNLALALFLGGNLSSNQLKVDSIFMDDPIQNMDDINIYSFVEVMRRLVKMSQKQIIISTHDDRIAQYMLGILGEEITPIRLKTLGVAE